MTQLAPLDTTHRPVRSPTTHLPPVHNTPAHQTLSSPGYDTPAPNPQNKLHLYEWHTQPHVCTTHSGSMSRTHPEPQPARIQFPHQQYCAPLTMLPSHPALCTPSAHARHTHSTLFYDPPTSPTRYTHFPCLWRSPVASPTTHPARPPIIFKAASSYDTPTLPANHILSTPTYGTPRPPAHLWHI